MKFESMTWAEKINARRALEAADMDMICFQVNGYVYAVPTDIRDSWIKQDRESSKRGGRVKARIRLNQLDRAALMNRVECIQLGTMEELTAAYERAYTLAQGKKAPHNVGWVYECAVTERLAGETWKPDNVPFWKAPDVVIKGIGYQVKGDGAEWFTEQCLQAAMAEMGY